MAVGRPVSARAAAAAVITVLNRPLRPWVPKTFCASRWVSAIRNIIRKPSSATCPSLWASRKLIDQASRIWPSAVELWLQGDLETAMQNIIRKPLRKKNWRLSPVLAIFGPGLSFGPDSSWLATVEKLTGMHLLNYGQCGECCDEFIPPQGKRQCRER